MSKINDAVTVQQDGGALIITLDRPQARNAVNAELAQGVAQALDLLDADQDLTVGIITGANGTFCSGMDLKAFLQGESPLGADRGFAGIVARPPVKPIIAAVDGYALAGGMEIALSCDLIVANRGAKFGLPEVKRGLVAAAGGLMRLPRQMPYRIALELALTGDFMEAEQMLAFGLINQLCEGPAVDTALALAHKIAANGPMAVKVTKEIVADSRLWAETDMWSRQAQISDPIFVSQDAQEGALAFAEKRAPKWTGQ